MSETAKLEVPESRLVSDRRGGLWRHYNDVGWVRLVRVYGGAIKERADLDAEWGPLTDVAIQRDELSEHFGVLGTGSNGGTE